MQNPLLFVEDCDWRILYDKHIGIVVLALQLILIELNKWKDNFRVTLLPTVLLARLAKAVV